MDCNDLVIKLLESELWPLNADIWNVIQSVGAIHRG